MTIFFFDTSALVKRYVAESGSSWVRAQCRPEAGHTIIISQATLVEVVATFCRKARELNINQSINVDDRDRYPDLFRQDVRKQYNVARVTTAIYTLAGDLCRVHGLCAYDAVQLACALEARNKLAALEISLLIFVSADMELLSMAHAGGLSIENPNLL
ncbi:MAG TPA: type II toxin-antitoxin system VapC family toxin [Ktedonobacteraceae bacterium]|jgi:predicted nucleic acid-binding protein|nr:type II toxin-antitoxin system VapC family toxin [Ktedonobacteraceae bacterium]